MMERITDSRRASCSSNSSSSNNGVSRRRPRFQTNEEEDEFYQVGMSLEEEEEAVPELRDRRAWRKERERERLRKLLNAGKKKKRRLATKPGSKTSCSGNSTVTVEPYKKTDGGGEVETGLIAQSYGTTLKLKRSSGSYTDQITSSSSIPRKARSVGLRRKAQIWRSIDLHSKDERPPPPPIQVLPQEGSTSSLARKDDIEAEIAEFLYGLKSQPSPSSEDIETESDAEEYPQPARRNFSKLGEEASLSGSSRMFKGAKIILRNKGKQILSSQEAKVEEAVGEKRKEMVVETEDDDSKPFAGFPGNQSDSVKKESETTTNEIPTSQSIKMEKPEKFVIDLMAPPPVEACTEEDDGVATSGAEAKINNTQESKLGTVTRDLMKEKFYGDEEVIGKKHRPDDVLVKCGSSDLPAPDQRHEQRDWLSGNSIPPKAQSSISSMPPWLTGGWSTQDQSTASRKLADSTSQPKRCTTHHRIARSILIHQQAMKVGVSPSVRSTNLPKSEKVVFGNLTQSNSLAGNLTSVKQESRDTEMYPHKYPASYQIPQPLMPSYATGRPRISSQSQHQARAASQIEESMSTVRPSSATVMRLSYMNNRTTPVWEILPCKPKSNEVSAAAARGEETSRRMAFYRGQSQPPPQVFSPIHNNIPLSSAAANYPHHHRQNTNGKKDSISIQWHQQTGTFIGSENKQPREQQQQTLAHFPSNLSGTRCLNFSANQIPMHHHYLSLSKPRASSTSQSEDMQAGGALVVDRPSRSQYSSLPSFSTTDSRVAHLILPTMKTFQVLPNNQQPSSLPANNNYPKDSFASPARFTPSQPHILQTDQLSKQNATSQNLLQISLGRNSTAQSHSQLQSLNSNPMMNFNNGSLASKSRIVTAASRLDNSSDGSRSISKGELLGQTDGTLGGFSQKSSLTVCGSRVPPIMAIQPNRPQELKY